MKNQKRALRRIKRALRALLGSAPTLQEATGAGRVFELYVMFRLAVALKARGWLVTPLDSNGSPLIPGQPFIQRGGLPSGVSPAIAGPASGASSLKIEKNGQEWELWNGVQFKGRSGAKHELDIAVVSHALANALRVPSALGASERFAFGRPRVGIECKDVQASGSPDEMRALIARMYDLTILRGHRRHLGLTLDGEIYDPEPGGSGFGLSTVTYLEQNSRCKTALVRRSKLSKGAGDMTSLFKISPHVEVTHPSVQATAMADELAHWMDANL